MTPETVSEQRFNQSGHEMFYLAAGPENGPLLVFVHGWPELSLSWRHQLPVLGGLGFRCVAPDMRGYGRSSLYDRYEDYSVEHLVGDLLRLLDHLDRKSAIWIGHDWGSAPVWSLASHHPEKCDGIVSLCVPYRTLELGLDALLESVNRKIYPEDQFPAGQWDYMRYYEESFSEAEAAFAQNPEAVVKLLFRCGDPAGFGKPAATAMVRKMGGWFGGGQPPDLPLDRRILSESELQIYANGLRSNGFFGPGAYYMNHDRNADFANSEVNGGHLEMPVLFLAAQYDYVCDCINSGLAEPMRSHCSWLREQTIYSGHWMAQERPHDVNREITRWLLEDLGEFWPIPKP